MNGMTLDIRQNWMRCYLPRPCARVQLVCFPPAGAAASFYRAWATRLPATVELLAMQYPGREDRSHEPGIDDLHLLADLAADALAFSAQRPLVLFGHDLGAALAFEVAIRLEQRQGSPLVRLVVSGRAPYQDDNAPRQADDESQVRRMHRLDGISSDGARPANLLPILLNDCRMSETYRLAPGSKLHSPIAAFAGNDDAEVSMDQLREWSKLTHGAFYARSFLGNHFYLMPNPGMVIAELLRSSGLATVNQPVWPGELAAEIVQR
jgi:pyochelin biosynthesis protein PchC